MGLRLMQHYTTEAAIAEDGVNSEDSDEVIIIELNKLTVTQCNSNSVYVSLEVRGKIMKFDCDTGVQYHVLMNTRISSYLVR